jgi:small GTP-binding protein
MNSSDGLIYKNSKQNSKLIKTVVILGSKEVGKTNILTRYTKKRFEEFYMETIGNRLIILGVDYFSKEIVFKTGNSMILSIWDTCGNELDLKILPSNVYKISSAYILVCSYDKRESFDMLKSWILHIQNYFTNNRRNTNNLNSSYIIPIMIIINKCDIKRDRKFSIKDVYKFADDYSLDILVYEVSAKDNTKIDYIFEKAAKLISGRLSLNNETVNTTLIDDDDSIFSNNKRRKSFKLKELKSIKSRNKSKSCCSKSD